MEKIIVTGACGFIGKNLVKTLATNDNYVIALDIHFDDDIASLKNVTCINVQNTDVFELERIIPVDNYDCMYLLAWVGTSGPARADYELQLNNVKLVCDYVMLCKKIHCRRIVYASSINEMETYEYLQSDSIIPSGGYIYGTGKLAGHLMGETVAHINGIEFIPVIITNIYGAGEKSARLINTSLRKLINGEHCSFTEGYQIYDFIYLTDAINSMIAVGQSGKAYNRYYIGSGQPKSLRSFLLEMRDIVAPGIELGFGEIPFNGKDISYDQFDMGKVERDTGYRNRISFSEGIELAVKSIIDEMRNL